MIWFGWVLWHINHCRLFNAKSFLYKYIKYIIWFGWVLWYIKHCRLSNAKFSLYIYIKDIWFGLVGFYGISTIVGYLMPNPFYTYILNIYMIWFGWVLWHINHCRLFNAKSFLYIYIKYIYHLETHFVDNILKRVWARFCSQLNGSKYCYITLTISHQSFVCTHSLFYLTHS